MTAPGTPDRDTIRARLAAAAPGPWHHDPDAAWPLDGTDHEFVYNHSDDGHDIIALTGVKGEHPRSSADAAFIAHARQDVADLLAEVDRLNRVILTVDQLHSVAIDDWARECTRLRAELVRVRDGAS